MRILIADDDPISLRLLENTLSHKDHEVLLAQDGAQAWSILTTPPYPEIALLDWMMPGLSGLEICRQYTNTNPRPFIYLIVVTSNDRPEQVSEGLDAGAHDYITKPFDKDELRSRIAVGGRIVAYEKSLKIANETLTRYSSQVENRARERADQLVQAERMIFLGTMTAGIAHEINNPLTIIQGNLTLITAFWNSFGDNIWKQAIQEQPALAQDQNAGVDIHDMLKTTVGAVQRLRSIVDSMRAYSHGQGGKMEIYNFMDCVKDSLQICLPKTKHLGEVIVSSEEIPFQLKGNPIQISQILVNIIANAADALAETHKSSIHVHVRSENGWLICSIQDNGPGIPAEVIDQIWSPLFTTKPVGKGTGLGLSISLKLAEEHGGELKVESQVGKGTTFFLRFPNAVEYDRLVSQNQLKNSFE